MTLPHAALPDLDKLDWAALKAIVIEQHTELITHKAELVSKNNEIESLKLLIMKLKRMQFGTSSERLARHIDQLELRLEDLETSRASRATRPLVESVASKPSRRPLAAWLPREVELLEPEEAQCPDCGGQLDHLGEDVSEMLEYVPARFKVIRTVRPKFNCTRCDRIVQEPAPHRPIERGLAGPG